MKNLPARVQRYIWLSLMPAGAVIGVAIAVDHTPSLPWPWLVYPLLTGAMWIGEEYRVITRPGQSYQTLTAAMHVPLILLLTPLEALAVAALAVICSFIRRRRPVHAITYNAVVRVVGVGVPALVLAVWRLHDPHFQGQRFLSIDQLHAVQWGAPGALFFGAELAAGCLFAALLYFVLDSALIAMIVALQTGDSPLIAWQTNVRSAMLPELTKSVLGIIAACLVVVNPIFVLFVLLPVGAAHFVSKAILRLERETIEAITALADTIDQRDPYTAQHSARVAAMTQQIARRLGLSRAEVDGITLAARVHDLGKMGTPNEILLKDGPLTPEEMAVMQQHSRIGAEVLQKYHNFHQAIPIVLHHHERYDGRGYPDGLAGDAIPLGAKIVAVADTYDAMTSDRPYRKGMRCEIAVQRIGENSGTQFDPAVAGVFVAMMAEELAAAGHPLPVTGGSLAEKAIARPLAAGGENAGSEKVRYLYRKEGN